MQAVLPPPLPHPPPFHGRHHTGVFPIPPSFYPWHGFVTYATANSPAHDPYMARFGYDRAAPPYPHPDTTPPIRPGHPPGAHVRSARPSHLDQRHAAPLPSAPLPLRARGPPLKAKQSGCAVWVGNLPDDATVVQLKDHFSASAWDAIESVFLIKKTSCAFVNYTNEASCRRAVQRFNRELFRGTRLVCRMRLGAASQQQSDSPVSPHSSDVSDLSPPSTPSSLHVPSEIDDGSPLIVTSDRKPDKEDDRRSSTSDASATFPTSLRSPTAPPKVSTRLFVLKSLTLQDLLVSTRDGTWVTQPHNEEKLNHAFHSADNVYLIFSVNKSGQYYGYARMESPIQSSSNSSNGSKVSEPPGQQYASHTDASAEMPYTFPTPATACAPAGNVINDATRGTIFWERLDTSAANAAQHPDGGAGKPFVIRWLSIKPVPFHATRGLRNPLNCDREVKIARDGTEVDAHTGSRLLQLFHRGEAAYWWTG